MNSRARYLVGRYLLRRQWLVWDAEFKVLRPLRKMDRR